MLFQLRFRKKKFSSLDFFKELHIHNILTYKIK